MERRESTFSPSCTVYVPSKWLNSQAFKDRQSPISRKERIKQYCHLLLLRDANGLLLSDVQVAALNTSNSSSFSFEYWGIVTSEDWLYVKESEEGYMMMLERDEQELNQLKEELGVDVDSILGIFR